MNMQVDIWGDVHVHNDEFKAVNNKGTAELAVMKKAVKERDNHMCQVCGEKDKILECHHIFPQSKYPDLIHNTSNMITLCQKCHRKYHDKFEGSEGAVSFAKYIRDESNGKF